MTQHNRTKDESYMICLYEEAEKTGDWETVFDRYHIGQLAHLNPKGVDTICKLLLQANFIKKADESQIYLTQNGIRLVESLRLE